MMPEMNFILLFFHVKFATVLHLTNISGFFLLNYWFKCFVLKVGNLETFKKSLFTFRNLNCKCNGTRKAHFFLDKLTYLCTYLPGEYACNAI